MFQFRSVRFVPGRLDAAFHLNAARMQPAISVPFLFGIVSGAVIGLYSNEPGELIYRLCLNINETGSASIAHCLWQAARFLVLAAFLSTGLTGVLLLPLLSAVRAFSFACSVSVVLHSLAIENVKFALFSFGFPALILLPGFLLAACDGFRLSQFLFSRDRRYHIGNDTLLRHGLIILIFTIADTVYLYYFMPFLLASFG